MLIPLYMLVWTCYTLLQSVKTLWEIRLYIPLKAVWSWPTSGIRKFRSILLQDFLNPYLHLETQFPVLRPCLNLRLPLVFRLNSRGQSWGSLLVLLDKTYSSGSTEASLKHYFFLIDYLELFIRKPGSHTLFLPHELCSQFLCCSACVQGNNCPGRLVRGNYWG